MERDEDLGVGGKLRRPIYRRHSSTPYSRPPPPTSRSTEPEPEAEPRRWLSKLVVDPARRLISGGASLFFPSFFAGPPPLEDCDDHHDKSETETEVQDNANDDQNCTVNHKIYKSVGVEGLSRGKDVSETVSDLIKQKQEAKHDTPDEKSLSEPVVEPISEPVEKGISDIEHLLKAKSFSREEVNRLMNIINSRAVEVPNLEQDKKYQDIGFGEAKRPVTPHEITDITSEKNRRDSHEPLWKASTPLHQSVVLDEVAASPIDIARAYMGSRRESGNFSMAKIPKDDRNSFYGSDSGSKPTIPSPVPKPLAYWPGSMVQDQRDYFTPQPQRTRYGLQNFSRTPYSRTIFSKSKSKVTPQLQGDTDKWLGQPYSAQKMQTPVFGQDKSRNKQLENNYASVGPMRRSRHNKFGSQSPFNTSGFIASSSSVGPSRANNEKSSKEFILPVNKNVETGAPSNGPQFQSADRRNRGFESSVPNVHPQTSRITRTILDHLDRNPPTPKDKMEELKLATEWNKSNSPSTSLLIGPNGRQKLAEENFGKSDSLLGAPSNPPRLGVFLSNGGYGLSQTKSLNEDITKTASSSQPPNSQKKPVLSSIFIDKPVSNWKFSSDQSSTGFTFPVSTTSGAFSEPPTPSITPSVLASNDQKKPKDGLEVIPTYTFGSENSKPALVFSFPSTSDAGVQNESSDIKFCFGSDKPRLSFSSVSICS